MFHRDNLTAKGFWRLRSYCMSKLFSLQESILGIMENFAKSFKTNKNFAKCKSLLFKVTLSALLAGYSVFLSLKKHY